MGLLDSGTLDGYWATLDGLEGGWAFTLRDFTIGDGSDYPWQAVDDPIAGLFGGAGYRLNLVPQSAGHGSNAAGVDFITERHVTGAIYVMAGSESEAEAALNALAGAWRPSEDGQLIDLIVESPAGGYLLRGKIDRPPAVTSGPIVHGVVPVVVSFIATDPRGYDVDPTVTIGDVGGASGGLTFPHGFPHTFGTVASGHLATLNEGTLGAPWLLTIVATDDLEDVSIELDSTDARLYYSEILTAGQRLTIDSARHALTVDGLDVSGRLIRPTSAWFDIPTGTDAVVVRAASGAGSAELAYRSAFNL